MIEEKFEKVFEFKEFDFFMEFFNETFDEDEKKLREKSKIGYIGEDYSSNVLADKYYRFLARSGAMSMRAVGDIALDGIFNRYIYEKFYNEFYKYFEDKINRDELGKNIKKIASTPIKISYKIKAVDR